MKRFIRGLAVLEPQGDKRFYHWITMREKQRMSMRKRFAQTRKSQDTLMNLLPLKCIRRVESRSDSVLRCRTQRQQERKLKNPLITMRKKVRMQPVLRAMSGRIKISPPIIPLTMPTTVMKGDRDLTPQLIQLQSTLQYRMNQFQC